MGKIREQVINFMEHSEQLSKLKGKKWYEMEDSLVEFVERLTGEKDTTYVSLGAIVRNWGNGVLSEEECTDLCNEIAKIKEPTFENFMKLVNRYFDNTKGEFDGLAMELESYFEGGEND